MAVRRDEVADSALPVQEFLVIATDGADHMTGTERSLERALATARCLAQTDWTVTVQSADPFFDDDVEYVVRRRR